MASSENTNDVALLVFSDIGTTTDGPSLTLARLTTRTELRQIGATECFRREEFGERFTDKLRQRRPHLWGWGCSPIDDVDQVDVRNAKLRSDEPK